MALKKYKELTSLNDETLAKDLAEATANYHSSKFEHTIKGLANPTELRHMRREVAMIETEIRKRELSKDLRLDIEDVQNKINGKKSSKDKSGRCP